MSSSNEENVITLFNLMKVADLTFLTKPIRFGKQYNVCFDETVVVFEIISRDEIIEDNLKHILWWNVTDYAVFHKEAEADIQTFMRSYPGIDYWLARKMIWNHNYIDLL